MKARVLIAAAAVVMATAVSSPARAQEAVPDTLVRVRSLYESADYEQALQLVSTLKGSAATNSEVAAYRVFCLVALGRSAEARVAVAEIVRTDPMFHPASNQVSPRIRQFFDDARQPLLGDAARQSYARAKAAYDKRDWVAARDGFASVANLIDEMKAADPSLSDLKTVAAGFRDLAAAAIQTDAAAAAAAAAAKPTPTPTPAATPVPAAPAPSPSPAAAAPAVYSDSDKDVTKPVVIARAMPAWRPTPLEMKMSFVGTLELLVGEDGKVLSAALPKAIHPRYDASLLAAAKTWTFQPATKNGTPVRYRYVMAINLTGPIK